MNIGHTLSRKYNVQNPWQAGISTSQIAQITTKLTRENAKIFVMLEDKETSVTYRFNKKRKGSTSIADSHTNGIQYEKLEKMLSLYGPEWENSDYRLSGTDVNPSKRINRVINVNTQK